MAKRKRLTPFALSEPPLDRLSGPEPGDSARAPIAQVAGDAATHAALSELSAELNHARQTGRLVQDLTLEAIKADHLTRDRIAQDPEEMAALKASLLARGQQIPVEVVELPDGAYGLISGFRRLQALSALREETGDARFDIVQALIKPLEGASASYVAMVEENEIRASLSFYERARLAAEAARIGVYPTAARAVQVLFTNTSSAKRSKINSFVKVHEILGPGLRFPTAIPEKLGLALASALQGDAGFERKVRAALRKAAPESPAAERAVLERALRKTAASKPRPDALKIGDLRLEAKAGRAILSGPGVTDALLEDLRRWLRQRK